MFLAHAPIGLALTRELQRRLGHPSKAWWVLGAVASVIPDLDLLRFYFLDHRRIHHHSYWTHLPVYWLGIALLGFTIAALARMTSLRDGLVVVLANCCVHLILDTLAGGIAWFYPWSNRSFVLVSVPGGHGSWILNFLLHWTFAIEVLLVLVSSAWLWRRRDSSP